MTPPLIGIERCITGDIVKAFDESGHGRRAAVVDRSYQIPRWAEHHNTREGSSADALKGILLLTPIETESGLIVMAADPEDTGPLCDRAFIAFEGVLTYFDNNDRNPTVNRDLDLLNRYRKDELEADLTESHGHDGTPNPGFYTVANKESEDTLFIRTPDDLPYACATFVIGHSQRS